MVVFLILVAIVIIGTIYSKKQRAVNKTKGDLGGAFVFVLFVIAIIVFFVSVLPSIRDGYNKKKSQSNSSSAQSDTSSTQDTVTSISLTLGQENAAKSAKDYIEVMAMSYKGLVKQLEFDGYSGSEAEFGAANCGADWNQQAAKAAKEYLSVMSMSKQALVDQLVYDGFTQEQAAYGVAAVGYT